MYLNKNGFMLFPFDAATALWARAARRAMAGAPRAPLRHGGTWFVGVDALPNDSRGAVAGVPLAGPWTRHVPALPQHRAQVSIVYPGYPGQDAGESDANHRYRRDRGAAHVDGLLPDGPARRRFAREYHAYVLGIPLNSCGAAPTLVWPGSHRVMGAMLRAALGGTAAPGAVDITERYHAARREVFAGGDAVPLRAGVGESFLIHRHALHGTAPWSGAALEEGRMIAFFRPVFADAEAWLGCNARQ